MEKIYIGNPEYEAIIMDCNGKAFDYEDINYSCFAGKIEIIISVELIKFDYDPIVEPEPIQLLEDDTALLTLRKRQLVVLISKDGRVLWEFGKEKTPMIINLN